MLKGCRVLDLTDEKGFLCGKILADQGADVIKVEQPGGDRSRRIGPFWADEPDPQKSLYWFAYNSNKRGITLDIATADGREIFGKLVKTADFVIESFPPGYLQKLGIGFSHLSSLNERLILTSITPFGQTGPYKDFKDSDLVIMSMAGILYQTGEPDGPPLQISIPQSCLLAGADAAAGTLTAYYWREKGGKGQQVDVSMQQSAGWFMANAIPAWELSGVVLKRSGTRRSGASKDAGMPQIWPCKDGYVAFFVIGGSKGSRDLRPLAEWMDREGMANEFLRQMDWNSLDMFKATREHIDQISKPVGEFFLKHTKKEILEGAIERDISIFPLSGIGDLLNDVHLKSRNFWTEIQHPELGVGITYPRAFARSSENDLSTRFRAPLIGEHNTEIYGELGFSRQDLVSLKQAGII
jgi:crotonobetainyl-CoA:carnitine CoA-transferase CaiB-like acyl-CoA transferase